jgi:peroxiredoxin Q/BCP
VDVIARKRAVRIAKSPELVLAAGMMKLSMLLLIVFVGCAMAGLGNGFAAGLPKVGDKAPAFEAPASDGSVVRLADHVGKANIVLYFYPKDDTPGCTKQACGIRDAFDELSDLNAIVFGVSFDSVESHKRFVEKHNLPFLLLADTGKKLAIAYGAATEESRTPSRATFVIDRDGKIAFVNPKVNPSTHAAELRTVLTGLGE